MKSKKFNAHKKHFDKKEAVFRKEIKYLKEKYQDINKENLQLNAENKQLKRENVDISAKYEKLLKYSKLTDEEIETALRANKSIDHLIAIMNMQI